MRLIKLSQFSRLIYAEGSAPALNTLRSLIRRDKLPGGRVHLEHFYVDMDAYEEVEGRIAEQRQRQTAIAKDPDMAGLI